MKTLSTLRYLSLFIFLAVQFTVHFSCTRLSTTSSDDNLLSFFTAIHVLCLSQHHAISYASVIEDSLEICPGFQLTQLRESLRWNHSAGTVDGVVP